MIRWEDATVLELRDEWPGIQRAWVESAVDGSRLSAISYVEMTGHLRPGQRIRINTNAVRRGLGTGGDAFVVADHDSTPAAEDFPAGHMMKARYTPLQLMVDAVDDPSSPHHSAIDSTTTLTGMPVVVADLHSALGPIVAGIREEWSEATVVYIHTDWAALPVAYSKLNATLRAEGLLHRTISAGQAIGGDREAVSIPSALAAASAVDDADVAIVTQGPGNLGTGTTWGYSGIAAADVLNQASAMGADPIMALRVSDADPRDRHRGLSHHSDTVLATMALSSVSLAVPAADARDPFDRDVAAALDTIAERRAPRNLPAHRSIEVPTAGLDAAIRALPVTVRSMGRGIDDDPKAFLYSALAGRAAAISGRRRRSRTAE